MNENNLNSAELARKQRKRRRKRLLILLLLLLFTGVMLGTSTYAWFTANKTVTVSDITVDVEAKNGIQISVDAQSWKSVVQTSDITSAQTTYSGSVNQLPSSMEPVSTNGVLDGNGLLGMYYGVVETSTNCSDNDSETQAACTSNSGTWVTGSCKMTSYTTAAACKTANYTWYSSSSVCVDPTVTTQANCSSGTWDANLAPGGQYILTATKETDTRGTAGRYVVFDLFFQVNQQTTVYMNLGDASGVFPGNSNSGIQNASRIAFVQLGHLASGSAPSAYQAITETASSTVDIWEPNYDVSTQTGVNNALANYDISTTTSHAVIPYVGVKAAISKANNQYLNSTNSTYFESVTPTITTTTGQTGQITFATLQAGVTKYRIYMWIEGQDIDCENTASGGNVEFNLGFTLEPSATPTPTPQP